MSRTDDRSGRPWSDADLAILRRLARENTPTRIISQKLGRTADAVRSEAEIESISLKPSNQSPYDRRANESNLTSRFPGPAPRIRREVRPGPLLPVRARWRNGAACPIATWPEWDVQIS